MIDVSDGLSRDLGHICEQSRVGAIVEVARIPIHDDVSKLTSTKRTSLEHALHDGEDHELLFAAAGDFSDLATPVGTITEGYGILLQHPDGRREPLEPKGWEHRL